MITKKLSQYYLYITFKKCQWQPITVTLKVLAKACRKGCSKSAIISSGLNRGIVCLTVSATDK